MSRVFYEPSKFGLAAAAFIAMAGTMASASEDFPRSGESLTIIVPWDPGGGVDVTMRALQPHLEEELGISVNIVNQPGGGSQVGLTQCLREAPDGYTVCASSLPSSNTTYMIPERGAPYSRADFVPVATIGMDNGSFIVRSDSRYGSLEELAEAAREIPGVITVGNAGRFTNAHLDLLVAEESLGVDFAHVFFTGGAPAVTALLGEHVDVVASTPSNYMGQYEAGDIRILGLMAETESELLPGVPTFKEQGYDVVSFTTRTLSVPAGTPDEVVAKLEEAVLAAAARPAFRERLADIGTEYTSMGAAETAELWDNVDANVDRLLLGN